MVTYSPLQGNDILTFKHSKLIQFKNATPEPQSTMGIFHPLHIQTIMPSSSCLTHSRNKQLLKNSKELHTKTQFRCYYLHNYSCQTHSNNCHFKIFIMFCSNTILCSSRSETFFSDPHDSESCKKLYTKSGCK